MRTAATDITAERRCSLGPRRCWIVVEQRFCRDQYAGEAVAALAGLLIDEGLLQVVGMGRCPQSLDGQHALACNAQERFTAGFLGHSINQHQASPALFEAATKRVPVRPR